MRERSHGFQIVCDWSNCALPLYLSFKHPLSIPSLPSSPLSSPPTHPASLLSSLLSFLLSSLLFLTPYQPGNIQLPPPALTWSHATGMLTPLLHCLSRWVEESATTQQVRRPSGFFPSLVLTRRSSSVAECVLLSMTHHGPVL